MLRSSILSARRLSAGDNEEENFFKKERKQKEGGGGGGGNALNNLEQNYFASYKATENKVKNSFKLANPLLK
jgi:molybdenum-dependent DNA-binding transcriptional regulator ModE